MPVAKFALVFDLSPTMLIVIAVVGVVLLGAVWFGVKFWLASTRPVDIKEVQTPNLDRLNRRALEAMGNDEEPEEEDVPDDLKKVADDPAEQAD